MHGWTICRRLELLYNELTTERKQTSLLLLRHVISKHYKHGLSHQVIEIMGATWVQKHLHALKTKFCV